MNSTEMKVINKIYRLQSQSHHKWLDLESLGY